MVYPDGASDFPRFSHTLNRAVAKAAPRRWKQLDAPILQRVAHGTGRRFRQTGGGYGRNRFNLDAVNKEKGPPLIISRQTMVGGPFSSPGGQKTRLGARAGIRQD